MTDEREAPAAPAGWYPDPAGIAALRWWDGTSWTDEVHAEPARRTPTWRRAVALALVVVLVLATGAAALAVWGGTRAAVRLDTAVVEREVARVLTQQQGVPVTVECPDDVLLEEGAVMSCRTSTADGSVGTVVVRQDNAEGDVTWRLAG